MGLILYAGLMLINYLQMRYLMYNTVLLSHKRSQIEVLEVPRPKSCNKIIKDEIGDCEVLAKSYRAVQTACRYDLPFRGYLGASKRAGSANNVRADNEHVSEFTSELGSHAVRLSKRPITREFR